MTIPGNTSSAFLLTLYNRDFFPWLHKLPVLYLAMSHKVICITSSISSVDRCYVWCIVPIYYIVSSFTFFFLFPADISAVWRATSLVFYLWHELFSHLILFVAAYSGLFDLILETVLLKWLLRLHYLGLGILILYWLCFHDTDKLLHSAVMNECFLWSLLLRIKETWFLNFIHFLS